MEGNSDTILRTTEKAKLRGNVSLCCRELNYPKRICQTKRNSRFLRAVRFLLLNESICIKITVFSNKINDGTIVQRDSDPIKILYP
jgi:hypothetical protein